MGDYAMDSSIRFNNNANYNYAGGHSYQGAHSAHNSSLVFGHNSYMGGVHGGYGNYQQHMMNQYMHANFSSQQDVETYQETMQNDYEVNQLAFGGGRNSERVAMKAQALAAAIENGDETLIGKYLKEMEKNPKMLAAVELAYDKAAGERTALRKDLRKELAGSKSTLKDNWLYGTGMKNFWLGRGVRKGLSWLVGKNPMTEKQAFKILNKGTDVSTAVAANALKDATQGMGTDKKTIDYVVKHGKDRMLEINRSYNEMGDMTSDIMKDYNWFDGINKEDKILEEIFDGLGGPEGNPAH